MSWKDKIYLFCDVEHLLFEDLQSYITLLPQDRIEKVFKYKREIDRKISIAAYLLLSISLAREFGITGPIRTAFNLHGKPFLKDYPDIYYNLSHCRLGVACALSKAPVGVDIEAIDESRMFFSRDIMTPRELERLCATKDAEQFFRLWVLKEATLKKTGTGLVDGAAHIEFIDYDEDIFYAYGSVYHLKKLSGLYFAVCGSHPVHYVSVSCDELLNG